MILEVDANYPLKMFKVQDFLSCWAGPFPLLKLKATKIVIDQFLDIIQYY